MFYLRHPEKMDEMIQLEVIFITNDDNRGNFESSKTLWIKGGKSDATTQAPPLEAFHIRLRRYVTLRRMRLYNLTEIAVSRGS